MPDSLAEFLRVYMARAVGQTYQLNRNLQKGPQVLLLGLQNANSLSEDHIYMNNVETSGSYWKGLSAAFAEVFCLNL